MNIYDLRKNYLISLKKHTKLKNVTQYVSIFSVLRKIDSQPKTIDLFKNINLSTPYDCHKNNLVYEYIKKYIPIFYKDPKSPYTYLNRLFSYLQKENYSFDIDGSIYKSIFYLPIEKLIKNNKHPIYKRINQEGRVPDRITGYSDDLRNNMIFYADNVLDEEKIPGLISFIKEQRDYIYRQSKVFKSLYDVFGQPSIEIPIILKKEKPQKLHKVKKDEDAIQLMIRKIVNQNNNNNGDMNNSQEANNKIKDIFKRSELKSIALSIWGQYHHNGCSTCRVTCDWCYLDARFRPCIEIYYRNIKSINEDDYKAKITNTLAHEWFHYCHDFWYYNNKHRAFNTETPVEISEKVIEGTADYCAFLYTLEVSNSNRYWLDFAFKKYESWLDLIVAGWPYAYALYFFYVCRGWIDYSENYTDYFQNDGFDKLKEVISCSIGISGDMKQAYNLMLTL